MLYYNFDSKGRFIDSEDVEKGLDGNYLVPRNSTRKKPHVAAAGMIVLYKDNEWIDVVDNVGKSYWTKEGEFVTITDYGVEIPENALTEKPDLRTFEEIQAQTIESLKQKHAEVLRTLSGNATIEERDTWQPKALAAQAFLDGTATEAQQQGLAVEAGMVGEDVSLLAAHIVAKNEVFHRMIGIAAGHHRKTKELFLECKNVEELYVAIEQAETTSQQLIAGYIASLQT